MGHSSMIEVQSHTGRSLGCRCGFFTKCESQRDGIKRLRLHAKYCDIAKNSKDTAFVSEKVVNTTDNAVFDKQQKSIRNHLVKN